MALALQMVLDWPLSVCYLVSSLVIMPLVMHGITLISRCRCGRSRSGSFLLCCRSSGSRCHSPQLSGLHAACRACAPGSKRFDPLMFGAAATVTFSLVVQIGEQVDYLRFLPERTRSQSRCAGGRAVLIAGPGWIVPGMLKMVGGAFLAFLALQHEIPDGTRDRAHADVPGGLRPCVDNRPGRWRSRCCSWSFRRSRST